MWSLLTKSAGSAARSADEALGCRQKSMRVGLIELPWFELLLFADSRLFSRIETTIPKLRFDVNFVTLFEIAKPHVADKDLWCLLTKSVEISC